jgi:hypothetical protein
MGWNCSACGRSKDVGGNSGILAEVQIETPSLSLRLRLTASRADIARQVFFK